MYEVYTGFAVNSISDVPPLEAFTELSRTYGTHWIYKDNIDVALVVNVNINPTPNLPISVDIWLSFVEIDREKYLPKI